MLEVICITSIMQQLELHVSLTIRCETFFLYVHGLLSVANFKHLNNMIPVLFRGIFVFFKESSSPD